MNEKLRKLLAQINAKKEEVKNLANENKLVEAKAAKEELINLQTQFDLTYDLEEETGKEAKACIKDKAKDTTTDKAVKEFANAARRGFKVSNSMNEGAGLDGGYTVPEEIVTQINTYKEAKSSLLELVTIKPANSNKGQITYKKRSQQTGFTKVGEGGKIGAKNTPKFERLVYEIEKYAGYFPVTNELLEDSDANISSTLVEWIGDESRCTANKLIIAEIAKLPQIAFKNLDDIKKAIIVTLGAAFKNSSSIITNDDGLLYLDTLKDSDGKYLLQTDPTNPMNLRLCAGATSLPIKVYPNDDLPTVSNKIPMIIGDLKEGIIYWDRKKLNIKMSTDAAIGDLNAFEEDLTLFRAIEREDVTVRDSEAIVNGSIDVTP